MTIEYRYKTLSELSSLLKPNAPVMFDTETDGLYGHITLAQFYQPDTAPYALFVQDPNPVELIAILHRLHVIGYNLAYDISTLQVQSTIPWSPELDKFDDVFLLAKLYFYDKEKFSLDNVVEYTLGDNIYTRYGIKKDDMHKATWRGRLTRDQEMYAALDVVLLNDVYNKVSRVANSQSYMLDKLTLKYCLQFQTNGLPVNLDKLMHMRSSNNKRINEIALPINANSYKQVRAYIGEEESDALALVKYELDGNERASAVNETRKLKKINSFLDKFETPDGRIYGKFAPSTRSGRLSCSDQNLQQLPRVTKELFGFEEDGDMVLIYSDFSQLELRCACVVTGEKRMAELFYDGKDLHDYTSQMIFGDGFTKTERQIAKTANFNLLYGGGANMLGSILIKQAKLAMEESELYSLKKKWHNLWPILTNWQQQGIAAWNAKRPWSTPLGRQYLGKMMTDQLNIAIQGHGADVAKLALHYMYKELKDHKYREVKLLNWVHDSYIFECPNDPDLYKDACNVISSSMQSAWRELSSLVKIKDLPMPVDVFVGYNWGAIEKGDFIHAHSV